VQRAGYDAAFLVLAVVATAAVLLALKVPETRDTPAIEHS